MSGQRTDGCILDQRWDDSWLGRLGGGTLDRRVSWDSQVSGWGRRLSSSSSSHGGVSQNDQRCARLAQKKEADGRVLWLGSSWYLFEVQMTGLE